MKYNWSIIGHEKQLEGLENDLASGNLAHAYLMTGPNSVGKFTVAKKLAGILQCEGDFCHNCNVCMQVEKGCHIDTVEMADNGESIKIDEMRKLIDRLSMTRQSKYKVVLIQSIERMGNEAANSFLKMLEEPPERTIFIMTTDKLKNLLPTIISRVRVVKFGSVSQDYIRNSLKNLFPELEAKTVEEVASLCMGKTGKAMQLASEPEVLAGYIKTYRDILNFLDNRNLADKFKYLDELLADEKQIEVFLDILVNVLRTRMLDGQSEDNRYLNLLSKVEETYILLGKNINSRLALENLMLEL
ncbi:MAG: AAA family ATPase [Patescibacteria group bacterium]